MERSRMGKTVKTKLAGLAILTALSGGCRATGGPWSATVDDNGNVAIEAKTVNINGTPIGGEHTLMGVGTPEALPATITSLRFQPNQSELNGGITKPNDQPGQERFVNKYLEAAMKATEAPINRPLSYVYPRKDTHSKDLYELVSGIQQEARDARATTYVGDEEGHHIVVPTGTVSVGWCNFSAQEGSLAFVQELADMETGGLINAVVYGSNRQYDTPQEYLNAIAADSSAALVDGRSSLVLIMPTDAGKATGDVFTMDATCDHPLGSWAVAVR